ncbi:acyl-CoA dehydrogenase family protein [Leptospira kirschneri]|uniref:acyl-CoA dehydrogenase family protein n=1 Tax=Leptospira kirschneri TaxID=29507 RepID=UPI0002785328|nr:acyl-CoA dehydrogenase family protein [Leptospira kirschneri]EJO71103.1 acyl-CoA dehydrogenase [Leptospira kirschneri serovar Grippotyphosa str. RM52]EKQ82299.1 acyl-CoA dehydrogenase, C-terminal domain protein [Leptospira kirschneri serovar Grippotyphosa str. Moskva]EKR07106.1 acyl-CoA dehydrogenase, C-terminal domain protein [Leptospira kirschneri serovar Valbuzzi str. 200702274]EMK01272.1 acyl-CoA dehydrogenase, C-terminal domain protein [Leptospira kirschneri str. MMD1493]EMK13656.1 acy
MIENNYFLENQDLQENFQFIIDWKEIINGFEDDFTDHKIFQKNGDESLSMAPGSYDEALEYYKSILESGGEIAGRQIASIAKDMDVEGLKYSSGKVTFPEAMIKGIEQVKNSGILPYSIGRKHGGLGVPATIQCMMLELFSRADGSFAISLGCLNLAETIERFGSKEMIDEYVPKMANGEIFGAMALTEPNYGSDLPNLQTKAIKDENGIWKLTGTKRFITHGCGFANIPAVILTLARTGTPTSGARGLSFFLVKSSDVFIAGIEKKMGLHCSPTCEVVYENTPGILIGEEGYGLVRYSMAMMNGARLSIAAQAMGIATAAYMEAKKYASEREQFGKTIQNIPAVRKMLSFMDREIAGMRAILLEASRSIDLYHWKSERMKEQKIEERVIKKDETIRKWEKLANLFTPLSKYYITEIANKIAYDALQIHGGAGFTYDYDISRIYRDVRITNIYEGTTQLQVVAAIGGIVSGMSSKGHLRQYFEEEFSKIGGGSTLLNENKDSLEKIVESYSSIENSSLRDEVAFEVVQSTARVLIGLLLEKGVSKLNNETKKKREILSRDYNLESKAILLSNRIIIEDRQTQLTFV